MKYQVSFRAKTGYLHMWKYHLCYDFNKLHLSDQKNYFSKMVWYFTGVYIINRTLHGRLERRNFALVKYFSTLEEKFLIPAQPCSILYFYSCLTCVMRRCVERWIDERMGGQMIWVGWKDLGFKTTARIDEWKDERQISLA